MTYLQKPGSPQEALNELTHYGVLGMKWGVRRTPEQLGRRTAAKKEKTAQKAKAKQQRNHPDAKRLRRAKRVRNVRTGIAAAGLAFTAHTLLKASSPKYNSIVKGSTAKLSKSVSKAVNKTDLGKLRIRDLIGDSNPGKINGAWAMGDGRPPIKINGAWAMPPMPKTRSDTFVDSLTKTAKNIKPDVNLTTPRPSAKANTEARIKRIEKGIANFDKISAQFRAELDQGNRDLYKNYVSGENGLNKIMSYDEWFKQVL